MGRLVRGLGYRCRMGGGRGRVFGEGGLGWVVERGDEGEGERVGE